MNHYKNLFHKDYFLFLATGMLNTFFGYALFSFFIYLSFHYTLAVFCSTVIGILFNYKTIGGLVFAHQGESRFVPFIAVYALLYSLNVYGLWQFESFGIDDKYIAGAILLFPLALLSFVLNKFWVFKN